VVILGGGVIGLSIAFELATAAVECTLVDPVPGRGASWAAAGMLSPAAEVAAGEGGMLSDFGAAAAMWPEFARRIEQAGAHHVGFAGTGSMLVGLTASDAREAARLAAVASSAGVVVEQLADEQVSALEPSLVGGPRGGWALPGDHSVDNRRLVEGLVASIKALGVTILEDRCIRIDPDATGVRCSLEHQGDLVSDRVVVATGATSCAPLGLDELGAPSIRPVRGATLRLAARPGTLLPRRTIRAIVEGVHCYLVPRCDRELVVGATSEEQGYEQVARAGGVFQLLDAARSILPGLDELVLEEVAVGLRPATPDHVPFVGPLQDPRVFAALGHYRNGVLLAPLTARRVTEAIGSAP
jgi:glycine oxidase